MMGPEMLEKTMKNKKPLGKKAYGSIPHLPGSRLGPGEHKVDPGTETMVLEKTKTWNQTVIVTEKLDGSNCSVAKIDGKIVALTRAGYEAHTSEFKQHHLFDKFVKIHGDRFYSLLQEGERIVGEWMIQAHGLVYRLHHEPFVVFDIMTGIDRIPYAELTERCMQFDFNTPMLVSYGPAVSIKEVMRRLKKSGHGCQSIPEGAVWRMEEKGEFKLICKYVRPNKVDGVFLEDGKVVFNEGVHEYTGE